MRTLVFSGLYLFLLSTLSSQTKTPFIFRVQEKSVSKHIHKYLHGDTLIETSAAKIHIHYSKDKGKPYLLLLHGMGVDAKTNWYKQIKSLSRHYNLLMPDLIYFGKSVAKKDDYSAEFQAEQVHEVLKTLKVDAKINIMGFSYGGLIAALYNQLYPNEIRKLIIIDGPVKFISGKITDSLASVIGVRSMTNIIIPQSLEDFKAMQKAVLSKKMPLTRNLKHKFMRHYFTPGIKPRQSQINYLTDHQNHYQNLNYNLETTPTLLIWGAKDGVVPLSVGKDLHLRFPLSTQLIVFKNAKHDSHFSYSKKLNKEVLKFLSN